MAQALHPRAAAVLDFWFGEGWQAAGANDRPTDRFKIWYGGGAELDAQIVALFGADCEALLAGQYDGWQAGPAPEALAGVIIGDQLFRNAFRGTKKMYAADEAVLSWVKQALAAGRQAELLPIQRIFLYMPLMHSEALEDQNECVARFEELQRDCAAAGWPDMAAMAGENITYARAHQETVAKWHRFPHRNAILGRDSTPEEAAAIADGTMPKW